MQADQTMPRSGGSGTSVVSMLALIAALLALALGGMAWWRTTTPWAMMWGGYGYAPMMTPSAGSGYGPGMMPWGGPGFGYGMMGPGRMGYGGMAQPETIATALGISVDELTAAERAGKSVATLAQEKGVDLQKVIDAVLAPHKAAMAAMAGASRMTQEQIDLMTKVMEAQLRAQFASPPAPGYGYGFGYGPGYGMMPGYGPSAR
jgi:hypothetical protein